MTHESDIQRIQRAHCWDVWRPRLYAAVTLLAVWGLLALVVREAGR